MLDEVKHCLNLNQDGIAFLQTIEQQMGIVADVSRADILLYGRQSAEEAVVLAHARPHSLAHVYLKSRVGRIATMDHRPEVLRVLLTGKPQQEHQSYISEGAPVVRQALPVVYPHPFAPPQPEERWGENPRVIAALIIVTNQIEYERHRLRSRVFRRALRKLQAMLLYGQIEGAGDLSPFGEQDGIIFTDNEGVIRYASGIATNLYRKMGFKDALVNRHLSELETEDEEIWREAIAANRCLQRETEEADRFWVRKVIPLVSYSAGEWNLLQKFNIVSPRARRYGALILLYDATETRLQDQEIRVKNAMIQEVHHRVKNNLQTIAGLIRMQARRVKSEEARLILDETLNRILSVAVIHEFLSNENSNIINIKDVSYRIIGQFKQGVLNPDKKINLKLSGDPIYLPARQATACSLIINELLQNAVEHGFEKKQEGCVHVNLEDNGDEVIINVSDDGDGLPGGFQLEQADSLGLQIVRILVEGDLRGQIHLNNGVSDGQGLSVTITFPKTIFRGEQGWNEHVSS